MSEQLQNLAHVPVGTQSTTNLIRNSEVIYKERSLELRRKAALRRRSRVGTEWFDIRLERLEKQCERNDRNVSDRTDEQKAALREHIRKHNAQRRKSENRNQRFWRLIRRREYRQMDRDHNIVITMYYEQSIGKYDYIMPTFDQSKVVDCSDIVEEVKLAIAEFYNLLAMAERGLIIPESRFDFFKRFEIDLKPNFFDQFLQSKSRKYYSRGFNSCPIRKFKDAL